MTIAYELRPVTEGDRAWLRWLHHVSMREVVEATWGWDEAVQDGYFERSFNLTGRSIVQIDGEDAGTLKVTRRPTEFYLDDIRIAPAFQGRGLGTALIGELQARARAESVPVGLQVVINNARARTLYERLGFRVIERAEWRFHMRWAPETISK